MEKLLKNIIEKNKKLTESLQEDAMEYLKTRIIDDGKTAHVTEFLGNFANKTRNEDSIFATGLTLNSLVNIWSFKSKGKVTWEENISEETKTLISKMTKYLLIKTKTNASLEGAFFSGSYHNQYTSLPYFYPTNYFKNLNGTDFIPDDFTKMDKTSIVAVSGYIEDKEFQRQRKIKHYGYDVPEKSMDYNEGLFPFWSSPAITESTVILALSKVHQLLDIE